MQDMCRSFVWVAGGQSPKDPRGNPALGFACGKQAFFPLSLTTSSGQNAQIQAETACWRQEDCLPRDFNAYDINGNRNPTGRDLQKCLRASPCSGAGFLNDRCFNKPVFKKPPQSTIRKFSASVLVLWFCCCYYGIGKKEEKKKKREKNISYTIFHYCVSV